MTSPSKAREAAIGFEAVKIALNQDKNGYVLKLSVHPNDTPEALFRTRVGTRYQVALVELDEQDQPVVPSGTEEGNRAVRQAGLLCADSTFQRWMFAHGLADEWGTGTAEDNVSEGLRAALDIDSRRALRTDAAARERFRQIVNDFEADLRRGAWRKT